MFFFSSSESTASVRAFAIVAAGSAPDRTSRPLFVRSTSSSRRSLVPGRVVSSPSATRRLTVAWMFARRMLTVRPSSFCDSGPLSLSRRSVANCIGVSPPAPLPSVRFAAARW